MNQTITDLEAAYKLAVDKRIECAGENPIGHRKMSGACEYIKRQLAEMVE